MGLQADNGGYFADSATHTTSVAKPSQREIWEMIAEELDAFSVRFLHLNAASLADLPPERPPSRCEQRHEWFLIFQNFIAEAEMHLSRQMTRHGLLKEPQFEENFLDWAEHTDALGPFLKLIDYQGFINRARQYREHSTDPVSKWAEVLEPNAAQRFQEIESRLAALEAEQSELIRERRWLLGRPEHDEQPSAGKALQCQIERQRYKNEVGMD